MSEWKKCSSCKTPIGFSKIFWICNVSTCRSLIKGLVFCKVSCWDAHLASARHREAWAEEKRSPTQAQHMKGEANPFKSTKKIESIVQSSQKHVSPFLNPTKKTIVRRKRKV